MSKNRICASHSIMCIPQLHDFRKAQTYHHTTLRATTVHEGEGGGGEEGVGVGGGGRGGGRGGGECTKTVASHLHTSAEAELIPRSTELRQPLLESRERELAVEDPAGGSGGGGGGGGGGGTAISKNNESKL